MSLTEIRLTLVKGLRPHRIEIEQALYSRIRDAVPDPVSGNDLEYQTGLRAAVTALVGYSLQVIEMGPGWSGTVPSSAVTQARRAARSGVSLGVVLRRYFVAHGLFGEIIAREVERSGLSIHESAHDDLRRTLEALLNHLTATIEDEYNQEREQAVRSPEQRRAEIVQRLLAGAPTEPIELDELGYELDAWHLGVIATGAKATATLQGLKAGLGRQLLPVSHERAVWAWLGGSRQVAAADVKRLVSAQRGTDVVLAIGESRQGLYGWRLTHQEAQAAQLVALHKPQKITRCADVILEAAVLRDEALTGLLVETYLTPLDNMRNGGQTARATLHAYFSTHRNISSAASALGVVRSTIDNRLAEIEKALHRPLDTCLAQLEVALRLEARGDGSSIDS